MQRVFVRLTYFHTMLENLMSNAFKAGVLIFTGISGRQKRWTEVEISIGWGLLSFRIKLVVKLLTSLLMLAVQLCLVSNITFD